MANAAVCIALTSRWKVETTLILKKGVLLVIVWSPLCFHHAKSGLKAVFELAKNRRSR